MRFHIFLVVSAPEDGHCTSDTSPISSADALVTGEVSEASAHAQQSGQGVTWVLKMWGCGKSMVNTWQRYGIKPDKPNHFGIYDEYVG